MVEYRVTKYDPANRDAGGAYTLHTWTSFSDIGYLFNGSALSEAEYLQVENAYIASALEFLHESGVSSLTVRELENHHGARLPFSEGASLSLEQLKTALSRTLREEFWCKLEGPDSFIHIGYDYYMYVGVPVRCSRAEQVAGELGLFVEPFRSPYGGPGAA